MFGRAKGLLPGVLSVAGAFLIQLGVGSYHGTFGNLLPYFSSYMRQKSPHLGDSDLAQVFSVGGLVQGVTYLLSGLIVIPILGSRGCLLFGCLMFTLGPILTYFTINTNTALVSLTYGVLGAGSVNLVMVPTLLIPTTWFPSHPGLVMGVVTSGFGLSSIVFSPLQTFLINPTNLPPSQEDNSTSVYFTQSEVLDRVPLSLLYLAAIYGGIFVLGCLLCVESPQTLSPGKAKGSGSHMDRLVEAINFLFTKTFTRKDFYFLFFARLFFLTIDSAFFIYWKTLAFTLSADDKLVSLIGGGSGVTNFLSRFVFGFLIDRFKFRYVMSGVAALLAVTQLSIFWIGQVSFPGLVACVWLTYFLSLVHYSTIPTQTFLKTLVSAQALAIFQPSFSGTVVGAIGLAESLSHIILALINAHIMSHDSDPHMFLWLFLTLAGLSFLALLSSFFVSDTNPDIAEEPEEEIAYKQTYM